MVAECYDLLILVGHNFGEEWVVVLVGLQKSNHTVGNAFTNTFRFLKTSETQMGNAEIPWCYNFT